MSMPQQFIVSHPVNPIPFQQYQQQPPKIKYTIILRNLHVSTTQEVLFIELKKLGIHPDSIKIQQPNKQVAQAFIGFDNKEKYEKAFSELQFKQILSKIITCSKYNAEIKEKYKVFIKDIEKGKDPREIMNLLTQFGNIQSISFILNSQNQIIGTGYFQLSSQEEVDKCLVKDRIKDLPFQLEKFQKQKKSNGLVIRNIKPTQDISKLKQEEKGAFATQESEKIKKIFATAGYSIINAIYHIGTSNCSCIVTLEKQSELQNLLDGFYKKDKKITDVLNSISPEVDILPQQDLNVDYQAIYIKDLALPEGENEAELKEKLVEFLTKHSSGPLSGIKVQKGEKPSTEKQFRESYFAQAFFKNGKSGVNFIQNYHKDPEFRNLFHNKQPIVTILLSKQLRNQMKRNLLQFNKNQATIQQEAQQQQQAIISHQQPYFQAQFQNRPYQQRVPQQHRRQGEQQKRQQFPPQQQGGHSQQQGGHSQQQGGHIQQQQQQQQQQQPQLQFSTVESIRQNLEVFLKQQKNIQFQTLGQLMFPKVLDELQKQGNDRTNAEKITGMMVDLDVFGVSDVLEILENNQEFSERLQEAVELINNQSQGQ